jgi:hypothetical protein
MDLLARPDADDAVLAFWADSHGKVGDPKARNLRHEYFAATCIFDRPQHHVNTCL